MRQPSYRVGALFGLISSLPFIAVSYLANALAGLAFIPFDLFDWLTRALPGSLITFGIDSLVTVLNALGLSVGETAKLAEQMLALVLIAFGGAILGMLVTYLLRQQPEDPVCAGLLAAVPFFFLFLLAEVMLGFSGSALVLMVWLLVAAAAWGVLLALALHRAIPDDVAVAGDEAIETAGVNRARRDALIKLTGAAAGLTLGAWALGRLAQADIGAVAQESGAGQPLPTAPPAATGAAGSAELPATPAGRSAPVPGVRPEITSNEEFYRIDINMRPPVIEGASWALLLDGLFRETRNLTLAELMAFPAVTQPITIGCISNRVGGDLIGTSYWTGLRLRDLLEEVGLSPEAGALSIEAQDGFYESVTAEDMFDERTLLVYGMNGETLPVEHGFPLRIYIPNRYGMKQPKWITRIEAVEVWRPGYWVERGWSREARPQIVSVVDSVAVDAVENGRVPVGGIAWAGDRGIRKVELRVDDGPWQEAQLRTPPISDLTWVQWRFDWPAQPGRHTFTVRATDGDGQLQTDALNDPHPDGATGYHSQSATI